MPIHVNPATILVPLETSDWTSSPSTIVRTWATCSTKRVAGRGMQLKCSLQWWTMHSIRWACTGCARPPLHGTMHPSSCSPEWVSPTRAGPANTTTRKASTLMLKTGAYLPPTQDLGRTELCVHPFNTPPCYVKLLWASAHSIAESYCNHIKQKN